MIETELFDRLSDYRLRSRSRWAGIALLLSVLIPYESIDNQPQFLWQLFSELPLSAVVAGLTPTIAGAVILLARRKAARAGSLALIVLAALSGAALAHKIGADAAAWGLLPLPHSFGGGASSALLAMALTAAGANLAFRAATRKAAHVLLIAAVGSALLYFAWPSRSEAPGVTIANQLAAIGDMPTLHFKIGAFTLATVAMWPGLIALLGLLHLKWPPRRSLSVLGMVAPFGFPLILMMLLLSWYMRADPGSALFAAAGATLEVTAALALLSAALETLGQELATRGQAGRAIPDGWSLEKAGAVSGLLVLLLCGGQWWLARPPKKGVSIVLGESSVAGDELYGQLIVEWSRSRWLWDRRVRSDSSASELLDVKARGSKMVSAGETLDPEVGSALQALARAGWRLDVASRGWYRLVSDVNSASRRRGLPYYLDPRVSISKTKDGLQRHLLVDSYRITTLKRFDVDGEIYAALHVRGFGERRGGHNLGLLGFSRDVQPFALVVLDSTDAHLVDLQKQVASDPPRCGEAFELERDALMQRCGKVLERLLKDEQAAKRATVSVVERHELQHQIDGPLLTLSRPVLKKLAGYVDETKERVNRELSAYVAQMTSDDSPHMGLVLPLRFAVLDERGIYHHAGVLALEALGSQPIRDGRGKVDPARAGEVFDALVALSEDQLRERAYQSWERLFGDPLQHAKRVD